ncbi:MAG: PorV/PorQ family protein [Bacteroidetes bacterium]|nr:PorV/PorQ family protein [Bacteroidota bacterium]MBU1421645.1 PorV/PorQ family protein [Bacteroidota bacterium]MBU2636680.1 PorV/PorQ family protein [Bacteroidota bacterium]
MKYSFFVIVIAIVLIPFNIYAGTGIGKYAGEFISIGVGGRALGMGGAYTALANDVTAGYWNPAGLSKINYPQLSLMHSEQFGSLVNYDYAAVAIPFGSNSSIGLSIIRLGIDGIPDTRNAWVDENGNGILDEDLVGSKITYFNAADWAMYFTYSKKYNDNFSYGVNLKLIRREMSVGSATGLGFDIGVQYSPFENILLGANFQDATTTLIAWNTGTNELISPTLKIGSAYIIEALGGRFAPAFDIDVRFENRRSASNLNLGPVSFDFHSGLEFDFKNVAALRVGYSDIGTVNFGAGVHLPKFDIDYTFATSKLTDSRFDNTHRVSIIFTFESEQFARNLHQR